ncbi:carbohydrate esterase family 9 protein [Vararia minispora EC-137]|uniref:Carbohydrate esterase family 9 protein n=1 Tax=Vararia minispora EC-137 TaxID=1314806 RepID=A0ACB8QFE1_9AGAM|nr:carbohydrate esterase family 9 protein [Vararia minispora EC-137]
MEKTVLPTTDSPHAHRHELRRPRMRSRFIGILAGLLAIQLCILLDPFALLLHPHEPDSTDLPFNHQKIVARCRTLDRTPSIPHGFHRRTESDRAVPGTPSVLIKNARIWTGEKDGMEVIEGDVFIDGGIIKGVGHFEKDDLDELGYHTHKIVVLDAKGAWLTPGIVDAHSHIGDASSPELDGASGDDNSLKGTIQPWLRSLDGLNTHDDSYRLSIAGGITTALVLPGSANAIGGQAFRIKLRKTKERSTTAMLVEPPSGLNGSEVDYYAPPRWRLMKYACALTRAPGRVYGATRMDTFWAFRQAYGKARQLKEFQDAYCEKALKGQWKDLGAFPEDLQWEMLVDVLRGKVKVQTHCYEAVDLDDLIRLSNEFKFPIAAVHHASEAYLVPDVLKRGYGHTPAVALFATNGRYKREAYRGSEFAPRILSQEGVDVVMKSDHPVLNSRYLLYEAQQAHYYGLAPSLALQAVTTKPAKVIGLDHRVGYVKEGWDADLVLWDSHPLALGATPQQVFIDGVQQLTSPHVVSKPTSFQSEPETPNFDKEVNRTLAYDGLPPLQPSKASGTVVFTNVKSIYTPAAGNSIRLQEVLMADGVAVVRDGALQCYGEDRACKTEALMADNTVRVVDLDRGALTPGLTSFGSPLGLKEIDQEPSTSDGRVPDPLKGNVPAILSGEDKVVRAVDGLVFEGRDALLAYRSGVTKAITAPLHSGFFAGLGTAFSTGAAHKLAPGAVLQEMTGLHVTVAHLGPGTPSISTQVAALRALLLGGRGVWAHVASGKVTLVVEAYSADVIATLIELKGEVERVKESTLQLTIVGAAEAHILAAELGAAEVGVVLSPVRPFPYTWEQKRILPGPPLTQEGAISRLVAHNVTVGVGVLEAWDARNARFDVAWAALEADGRLDKAQALALASTNLDKLLGAEASSPQFVATSGGDLLEFGSKVVAVLDPAGGVVDFF